MNRIKVRHSTLGEDILKTSQAFAPRTAWRALVLGSASSLALACMAQPAFAQDASDEDEQLDLGTARDHETTIPGIIRPTRSAS